MSRNRAPLAPHIQIYRPQLTSVLSIAHRITGIALTAGSVLLVAWLLAASAGPDAYAPVVAFLRSVPGYVLLLLWTFSLFFHLCNGIRHLFWDAGRGFDLRTIYLSGYAVVAVSLALTAIVWAASWFAAR